MKWFTKKEIDITLPQEECDHDWEVVGHSDYYGCYWKFSGVIDEIITKEEYNKIKDNDDYGYYKKLPNKVCLKCGECYDGDKIAQEWLQNKKIEEEQRGKERQQRKELAIKMWENCNE